MQKDSDLLSSISSEEELGDHLYNLTAFSKHPKNLEKVIIASKLWKKLLIDSNSHNSTSKTADHEKSSERCNREFLISQSKSSATSNFLKKFKKEHLNSSLNIQTLKDYPNSKVFLMKKLAILWLKSRDENQIFLFFFQISLLIKRNNLKSRGSQRF